MMKVKCEKCGAEIGAEEFRSYFEIVRRKQ